MLLGLRAGLCISSCLFRVSKSIRLFQVFRGSSYSSYWLLITKVTCPACQVYMPTTTLQLWQEHYEQLRRSLLATNTLSNWPEHKETLKRCSKLAAELDSRCESEKTGCYMRQKHCQHEHAKEAGRHLFVHCLQAKSLVLPSAIASLASCCKVPMFR
jgi:hypothetical protein